MNAVHFGECLKQLLLIRNWPASRLAKDINVEPSYVRMWIRGERIPSIRSDYVHKISVSIVYGLDSPLKKPVVDAYDQYFNSLGLIRDESKSLSHSIETVLNSAQIYSLSSAPPKKNREPSDENSRLKTTTSTEIISELKNSYHKSNEASFTGIPLYIEGYTSIIDKILSVLREFVKDKDRNTNQIIITSQSDADIFSSDIAAYCIWKSLISKMMKKGWIVHHLYRINNNMARSLKLVNTIVELSDCLENYQLSYFTRYGTNELSLEYLIIGETTAFILMTGENGNFIDQALYFNQKEIVTALLKYSVNISRYTKPMFRFFSDLMELVRFFTLKYTQNSDFFAVSLGLHPYTIPLSLWERNLSNLYTDEEVRNKKYSIIAQNTKVMKENAERYRIKYIFYMEVIEYMLDTGDCMFDYCGWRPSPHDILEHIRHIIYLLRTYEKFEIALIVSDQDSIILPAAVWEIRGRHDVGIISIRMDKQNDYVFATINDETIACAFNDHFQNIWEHITPRNKDKAFVVSWFEEKAIMYERKISDSFEVK